jgi:type III pantothenate kinase
LSNQTEIIAADIGNTNTTVAHMRGPDVLLQFDIPSGAHPEDFRLSLKSGLPPDAFSLPLVIASVNPPATVTLESAWKQLGGARSYALGRDFVVPITNHANPPERVGQDRLVNALAAAQLAEGNAIVVDFGSAVSFDVVKDGAFAGGVLTPGIGLAMEALHQKTALLPLVRPDGIRPPVIGTNTEDAINSGVYYGYIGLVNNILRELLKTYHTRPTVFATGGYGAYLAPEIDGIDQIAATLTHQGIALAWQLTQ